MGYRRHHAIIVTSWDGPSLVTARHRACSIFPWVSPISPPAVNGFRSFFVPPDGSNEGRLLSDEADDRRDEFINWLKNGGGRMCSWAEVQFGDEDGKNQLRRRG